MGQLWKDLRRASKPLRTAPSKPRWGPPWYSGRQVGVTGAALARQETQGRAPAQKGSVQQVKEGTGWKRREQLWERKYILEILIFFSPGKRVFIRIWGGGRGTTGMTPQRSNIPVYLQVEISEKYFLREIKFSLSVSSHRWHMEATLIIFGLRHCGGKPRMLSIIIVKEPQTINTCKLALWERFYS